MKECIFYVERFEKPKLTAENGIRALLTCITYAFVYIHKRLREAYT